MARPEERCPVFFLGALGVVVCIDGYVVAA